MKRMKRIIACALAGAMALFTLSACTPAAQSESEQNAEAETSGKNNLPKVTQLKLGETATIGDYEITLDGDPYWNAGDEDGGVIFKNVAGNYRYADDPEEGTQYLCFPITVTNLGKEEMPFLYSHGELYINGDYKYEKGQSTIDYIQPLQTISGELYFEIPEAMIEKAETLTLYYGMPLDPEAPYPSDNISDGIDGVFEISFKF